MYICLTPKLINMQSIFKIIGLFILFLTFQSALFSQEYLATDYEFFQKKAKLYQRWLDAKGMGKVLQVDKVEMKKNGMELEMFLSLKTTDPDSAAALWRGLEQKIERTDRDKKLGTLLYQTFTRLMEIPQTQGNVQVYFPRKDGGGYNPCFYVWLWEENGKVLEESRINNCRAQDLEIPITLPALKKLAVNEKSRIYKKEEAHAVFDHIIAYARQRYESEKINCEERNPRVEEEDRTNYALKFTVTDLCREILTDEKQSIWCNFVELWWGECNDMRRERLEFSFKYVLTESGYVLIGELTGKFGSGVYRPRISGYMDMEPDFEVDFLKPYVRRFQKDLKNYLENQK